MKDICHIFEVQNQYYYSDNIIGIKIESPLILISLVCVISRATLHCAMNHRRKEKFFELSFEITKENKCGVNCKVNRLLVMIFKINVMLILVD